MKKYFAVSFKYSESVYCSNIAHAETAEAVAAHYSKYEWVDIREAEAHEVETARRKGMPIVEIETPEPITEDKEENTVKEFTEIKKIVLEDAEQTAENRRFFILNGYMPTWAEEHHGDLDRGLKQYSTARAVQGRGDHPGEGRGACHKASLEGNREGHRRKAGKARQSSRRP